jgi:hypothetical protein
LATVSVHNDIAEQHFAHYSVVVEYYLELVELLEVALRCETLIHVDYMVAFHDDFALCNPVPALADKLMDPALAVHCQVQHCVRFEVKLGLKIK